MSEIKVEQIRNFRLQSNHLDKKYQREDIAELVGACGMQNTPPGAWETSLYNRVPDCSISEMEHLLYKEKSLLQAWSLRGAPFIFPVMESDVFLSALISEEGEPWIYTGGISLALDFLQMNFDELFNILKQVIPQLDNKIITSKSTLDQTLAEWMLPLLPNEKQKLWNKPSMYGSPDKQTVGGAVVSFMLRPCSFKGLVVFGERSGISPTFTSYENWIEKPLKVSENASNGLVRKFLHCYGPTTDDKFVSWLGCSPKQGKRIWETISEEMEPVKVFGKNAYILSIDKERLISPVSFERELFLLGAHDPYLDQRDRFILQSDKLLQKQIWRFVSNPGVILYRGEVIGIWRSKKKNKGIEIKMTLWDKFHVKQKLFDLAEEYANFRQQKLVSVEI